MAFFGEADRMHNIVYIFTVLVSCSFAVVTFANVAFITKHPEKVRTYPGQHVTLPCVAENLPENSTVRWLQADNRESKVISNNRIVNKSRIENIGENYSIIGDGMNFTLRFKIPDTIDFAFNVTKAYACTVIKSDGYLLEIFALSYVIIQRLNILNSICGEIKTYYVIGETLALSCYNDPDPTVITTLKSGNGSVLPTYLDKTNYIMHSFNLTKEDHNAMFVCELRRNGTIEIQNCLMGPIIVNYKPEINIIQKPLMKFNCTAEARPPVNVTHWIVEPIIPQDSFTISNGVLRIIKPLKVESEIKITCEAKNAIGKGNKTLSIPTVNNRDDDNRLDSTLMIIIVSGLLCIVALLVIVSLYLYKSYRNKVLTNLYDDTIVDQTSKQDDGYQIPIRSVCEHYQSLKITGTMNTKEEEKVGYDIDLPNAGQSLEVTSSSAIYVNTLNKNRRQINKIESDPTSNAKGEEVTYVNNPRVKKCQFPGNVHPTNIDIDKETDTGFKTVPNLVTHGNTNNKGSHHPETTADVHYINLKIKAS